MTILTAAAVVFIVATGWAGYLLARSGAGDDF